MVFCEIEMKREVMEFFQIFSEQGANKMATEAYLAVLRRETFCEATPLSEKMGKL
jgi:hypothetical protein